MPSTAARFSSLAPPPSDSQRAIAPAQSATRSLRPHARLSQAYRIPDWFRDAKFGIWSHWGPQSAIEARRLVRPQHVHPGHRPVSGTTAKPTAIPPKSATRTWSISGRPTSGIPDHLIGLYKKAGAKYFFSHGRAPRQLRSLELEVHALECGQHGPEKDVVGMWADGGAQAGTAFRRQRAPLDQLQMVLRQPHVRCDRPAGRRLL